MTSVRCKQCNRELTSSNKFQTCGCPNMLTLSGDNITAVDLSKVILTNSDNSKGNKALSSQDMQFQEERRKRKVRRLDFEVR